MTNTGLSGAFDLPTQSTISTIICNFFGVEIFSDGALCPKFCYANIFPTLIFIIEHAHTQVHAKRAQRRRTSIFPLLLPEQDQPRMPILRYFKPPLSLYERKSLLTHILVPAFLVLHSKFWKYFGRRGASENKVTRKFIKRKFCKRTEGKLQYMK